MTATAARAVPAAPRPVLDDYVRAHIRARAVWLCQQEGFCPDEREDLEQELALEAIRRFAKHQPHLSGLRTFLVRAVNGKVSKLRRDRGTEKAHFHQQVEPLEEREARRLRKPGRSAQELHDLRMDVAHMVASLPANLREVCQQLMEGDPPEAFPPNVMWELRQRFEAAGLRDYLVEREYWLRLRCDPQISQYVLAARALGFDVATVLYDVTRKPTIKPVQVPILDEAGQKIVLDAQGQRVLTKAGKPRQTGDAQQGFVLQARPETPVEYGERLLDDIGDRPDFYFQRREVPRLEDELAVFQTELWQQAEQLAETQRYGRWFRNVGKLTCDHCQFANLCLNSIRVEPGVAPSGFEIRETHPELAAA